MELEQFISQTLNRPLSNHPMTRIRTLAKELAEGAVEGVWGASILTFRGSFNDLAVQDYLKARWDENFPSLDLLIHNDYLQLDTNRQNSSQATLHITRAAFDLLGEVEPSSIFISYRREDSSAFALLVLARLKAAGLDAFLDLTIQPGVNWRTHIQDEVVARDHFILLIGKQTLKSDVVLEEVEWALQSGSNIMPIWHNHYAYRQDEFDLPYEIAATLENTHTIRVLEESALGYNNAIIELLNRFGITP
jgi:hypothetical protein